LRGIKVVAHMSPEDMKKDCEDFFTSEYFSILSKIKGKVLMKKLQEEYENERDTCPKHKTPNRHYL
jgi:hypothetical protein